MSRKYGFVLLLGLLVGPTSLNAQGANSDLRIIGLPVLAADGIKIGQVVSSGSEAAEEGLDEDAK